MPSPFPGMDPYLENPSWSSFHFSFSAEIARQLSPKLKPRYVVLAEERFVLDVPDVVAVTAASGPVDTVYPDVGVVEAGKHNAAEDAMAVAPAPLQVATVMPERVPHVTIEIRDVAERELVTAIEVLSPTNKRGEGHREYLAKREHILLSTAHLIEIDLLRAGRRVPMRQPLPPAPYFIFVSRSEKRPLTDVWPVVLSQSLPVVPVPLLPGDPDVALDLQAAFTAVYDLVGYDRLIDYTRLPETPLEGEAAAWAAERVRAARR